MSERSDVKELATAINEKHGLVYSEVLGWIDMGHAKGTDIKVLLDRMQQGEMSDQPSYSVSYAQSMKLRSVGACYGASTQWKIKRGRSLHERHSIALAMMMATARRFEGDVQGWPFNWFRDSGFSAEDLVSDLLGFYTVARGTSYFPLLKIVSKEKALRRWDHYGPIGKYKNTTFQPLLFPDPDIEANKHAKPFLSALPPFMMTIQPFSSFNNSTVIPAKTGIHAEFNWSMSDQWNKDHACDFAK